MGATIKDVAEYTGLSVGTISKYINGGTVKEKNRIIIERAINDLKFSVNEIARNLKTSKTKTIGIIIPSLENLFCTSLISYVEESLSKKGYSTIICNYREDTNLEKEKLKLMLNKMVDGIIIIPSVKIKDALIDVINRGIPVVLIDRLVKDVNCDTIVVDNFNASYIAVEHLIIKGHKRTAIICGPDNVYTAKERLRGYLAVYEDYNIEVDHNLIRFGDYYTQSGYKLCKELIEMKEPPTAIFVTNYAMTLGLIMALNEKNIKVPDEISIIGFDNLLISKIVKPSLTIIIQPMKQLGEAAANIMLKRLQDDKDDFPSLIRLKGELLIKDSVANINNLV